MHTCVLGKVILVPNVYRAEVRRRPCTWPSSTVTDTPGKHEANRTITERISPKTETPGVWVRNAEASDGGMPAASVSEADTELQALRRKNAGVDAQRERLSAASGESHLHRAGDAR